jgi:hypothetical protein
MNESISRRLITTQKEKPIEYSYTEVMSFYQWRDQIINKYKIIDVTPEVFAKELIYHHNKQYQWTLADAFSAYEKFLKKVSSYLFLIDGTVIKADSSSKILARIRNIFPKYAELESCTIKEVPIDMIKRYFPSDISSKLINKNGSWNDDYKDIFQKVINNKFFLSLIEQMRHKIAHCDGVVENKEDFLNDILSAIGITGEKNKRKYMEILDAYFYMPEYKNVIMLLEVQEDNNFGFETYTDVLNNLIQILLNSAYYIYREITETNDSSNGGFDDS